MAGVLQISISSDPPEGKNQSLNYEKNVMKKMKTCVSKPGIKCCKIGPTKQKTMFKVVKYKKKYEQND